MDAASNVEEVSDGAPSTPSTPTAVKSSLKKASTISDLSRNPADDGHTKPVMQGRKKRTRFANNDPNDDRDTTYSSESTDDDDAPIARTSPRHLRSRSRPGLSTARHQSRGSKGS